MLSLSADTITDWTVSQRLAWMHRVWTHKELAKSSCYAACMNFVRKFSKSTQNNYRFVLVTARRQPFPTHCIVLSLKHMRIVFDPAVMEPQVGMRIDPNVPVYKPGYRVLAIVSPERIKQGNFK